MFAVVECELNDFRSFVCSFAFRFSFDPYRSDTFWAVFLGLTVQWAGAYCVSQTQVQRYNSMKSKKLARK